MDRLLDFENYANSRRMISGVKGYSVGVVYREESGFGTGNKKPNLIPFLEIDKKFAPSIRLEAARRISYIDDPVELVKSLESADINLESLYKLKLESKSLLDRILARDPEKTLTDFYMVERENARIEKEKEERKAAREKEAAEKAKLIHLSCEFVKNGGGESCENLFSDSFESNACTSCRSLIGV